MPDNPYPEWRQRACEWCALGRPFCDHVERKHWIDHLAATVDCTAPTEAERIAALESALIVAKGYIRTWPDSPASRSVIARIDAAMKEAENG